MMGIWTKVKGSNVIVSAVLASVKESTKIPNGVLRHESVSLRSLCTRLANSFSS